MSNIHQEQAAAAFAARWQGKGYEKGESQKFWIDLLGSVLGVEQPTEWIEFEEQVKLDHTSFIDGHIRRTHTLIEQKSLGKDLRAPIKQSDGSMLSPFQQAKRYAAELPYSQRPRWIVTCNFSDFLIYDMEQPNGEPEHIELANLGKEYYRLQFLVNTGDAHIQREMEISLKAGQLVGMLYDKLLEQYIDPSSAETLRSLNILCVRLVFCLYAEDAGVFPGHDMFQNYLASFQPQNVRKALIDLFRVLDTKQEDRDPYMEDNLRAFPYVNGGLFAEANIEIPRFTEEIVTMLLSNASLGFDWSGISPTIFGAVFESTLNPETRRSGGMHYTSIENIHKVIDPLFLDELRGDLEAAKNDRQLKALQAKLSTLTFLDPACGSGNFLTETYISLRRIENEILLRLQRGQGWLFGDEKFTPVKVSISQFYGIEINDFAVTVARTALWIAEHQMLKETQKIVFHDLDFLPLKSYNNIREGDALKMAWDYIEEREERVDVYANETNIVEGGGVMIAREPVVHYGKINLHSDKITIGQPEVYRYKRKVYYDYIMGNPPFVGKKEQTKEQKAELMALFDKKCKGVGNLDFVTGWYKKAIDCIKGTNTCCAFVSTNSITQGEQVPILYRAFEKTPLHINFAYRTFRWDSESTQKAHVHCVIIGFADFDKTEKFIITEQNVKKPVANINLYLLDAEDVVLENRAKPICSVPNISYGSMPIDDGHLILEKDDVDLLLKENPRNAAFIRRYAGGQELLQGKERWCLWLVGTSSADMQRSHFIMERIKRCKEFRQSSNRPQTLELANTPYLFGEIRQPDTNMLVIPKVSSEQRRYIPISFVTPETVINGSALIVPNATLYEFGVLMSNVHNAWMRAVAGRLEMRYQYSGGIVYNNFPWPEPTVEQRKKIEETAQQILAARALYPNDSLSAQYNENTMQVALRRAHQNNDRAVMQAYGFPVKNFTEQDCVACLMELYKGLTK